MGFTVRGCEILAGSSTGDQNRVTDSEIFAFGGVKRLSFVEEEDVFFEALKDDRLEKLCTDLFETTGSLDLLVGRRSLSPRVGV